MFAQSFAIFQHISPSPSSHIYSFSVLHLLCRRINTCCPASLPLRLSAAVLTADLVYHPHYPRAEIRPQVGSRFLSIFSHSVAVLSSIFPSLSSHISYVAVPHLLHRHIHSCCPTYPPPYSSVAVFTTDLFYHPQQSAHISYCISR